MAQSIFATRKKRGRPPTGSDPTIGLRLPKELIAAIEGYAKEQGITRSDTIRKFIEAGLKKGGYLPKG